MKCELSSKEYALCRLGEKPTEFTCLMCIAKGISIDLDAILHAASKFLAPVEVTDQFLAHGVRIVDRMEMLQRYISKYFKQEVAELEKESQAFFKRLTDRYKLILNGNAKYID